MANDTIHRPVLDPSILLSHIDWSQLRAIDRIAEPTITLPASVNGETLQLIQWLWAAEDSTKQRRASPASSWLGNQTSSQIADYEAGSFVTTYEHGEIWAIGSKPHITATFIVLGAIRDRFRAIGRAKSFLGRPESEELPILNGRARFQKFATGEMYWSLMTSACEVYGDIFAHYTSIGKFNSWLGLPLTGELPMAGGRFNTFEKGQITWRASDRHIEAKTIQDVIVAKYNALGGIRSALGLPLSPGMEAAKAGGAFQTSFRGGDIWFPFTEPNGSGRQLVQTEVWFRGLECQVHQENISDEMFASVGCFVPSTLAVSHDRFGADMGQQNKRIAKYDSLLYRGPPTHLYISSGLRELDDDNPFTIPTWGTGDQGWYESAPTSIQRFGAPTGLTAAEALQREDIVAPFPYKIWFQNKYYEDWNAADQSGSDLYPPGFLHISPAELDQQLPVKRLVRLTDDNKTLNYTHTFTLTATDGGISEGDRGYYAFYFEVRVTRVENDI